MKRLIILLLLITSILNGYCQDTTAVVTLNGNLTSDQLFKKAKEWYALTFKSANDVIQLSDLDTKKIIAKGEVEFSYRVNSFHFPYIYAFTLSVQFKDGRYKYDLTNTRAFAKEKGGVETSMEDFKKMQTPEGYRELLKGVKFGGMVNVEKASKQANENYSNMRSIQYNLIKSLTDYLNMDKNNNW